MSNPRDVTARVSMDPSKYVSGAEKVTWATKQMLREQETADRKWRAMQGAHQSALNEEAARQAKVAAAATQAEKRKQDAISKTSNVLAVGGAAAVLGAGVMIKTFATFDKQMSAVKATGAATGTELDRLRDKAIELGAKTSFSATESAAGIENLLKAGVKAQDVLGGGLAGALDLAAAGELGVADAAEIAATAMTQFKLGGGDVTHIADLLAAGAGKAQGSVDDLAQGLKQGGLVAAQTGLTLEETTGTLAAFASAGLLGSDAGTSMKTMLQRLSAPTKENAALMESLGISAYDAAGNFVGMEQFAGQLTAALGDMTPAQRNAALATIFGSDAVRAASVVYEQGESGIRSWISAVDDQGYAAKVAADRLDNLNGDIEALGGALESAFIKSGSGGNDMLRGLTQGVTGLVNALGGIDGDVLSGLTLALGAGGVLALGVAGTGKLIVGLNNAKDAMSSLGIMSEAAATKTAKVGTTIGKWAIGIGAAVVALETLNQVTNRAALGTEEVDAKVRGLASSKDVVKDLFGDLVPKDSDLLRGKEFATFLDQMADPGAWTTIASHAGDLGVSVTRVFGDQTAKWGELKQRMGQYGDSLGKLATTDMPATVQSFLAMQRAAGNYRGVGEDLLKVMPGLRDSLLGIADGAGLATDDATLLQIATGQLIPTTTSATDAIEVNKEAQQAAAEADADRTKSIQDMVDALNAQLEAQEAVSGELLSARDAHRGLEEAIDAANKAVKDNGATLDLTTKKGRANQEALDGIAKAGRDYVQSLRDQGASQGEIDKALGRTREQFLKVAESMGLAPKKAKELARELGLLPDAEIKVDADTKPAREKGETARDYISRLKATMAIEADGSLARQDGETTGDYISRLKATIEVDGYTIPARKKGEDAEAYISRLLAVIAVGADTVPARKKGESAQHYINRLKSMIPVDADTDGAQRAVDKFVVQNGGRTIKIGAHIVTQGDGEGAGWPGSTPHGVSAMTKALKGIDPGAHVTSGYRPGAVTATGYPSYHGMGRAIDIVSPNMGATWDKLRSAFGSRAKELYYSPRGFIRNGQMTNDVADVTRRMHYSHVHLALAKGGKVTGPGTGTSDDVLMWGSNGEHMWTEREVQAAGGHDAVYRLRAAALAGELDGYKTGGAIGSAERGVESAKRELERARKARRDAKKDKAREAAEKRVTKAEERYADARERLSNLRSERTDFASSLRRGDIVSQAASGISGAYSVIDEMLGLARSGDLTKGQSNRLARMARQAESAMRGLYKQVDAVDKKLEKAAANTEKLQGIADGVKNAIVGEQKLSGSIKEGQEGAFRDVVRTNSRGETWNEQVWDPGTKSSVTAKGMVADARSKVAKAKAFAGKLGQLRKAGMSGVLLDEIANEGIDNGTLIADAWLADKGQISNINAAYKGLSKYGGQAGQSVTEGYSKGGLAAAKSFEDGLEKQKASLKKRVYNWGVTMANGYQAALTGKKTGFKKRAGGGPIAAGETYLTGELGPELIVPSRNGYVLTADQTRRLATPSQTMTARTQTVHTGPLVNVTVEQMVAADTNAATRQLTNRLTDAIHTYGLDRLAAGV